MTVPKAIINLGTSEMIRGSTYVALSRTTRVEDILIDIEYELNQLLNVMYNKLIDKILKF